MVSFLLLNGEQVLSSRRLSRVAYMEDIFTPSSSRCPLIASIIIFLPKLCQFHRPPSLCIRHWFGRRDVVLNGLLDYIVQFLGILV